MADPFFTSISTEVVEHLEEAFATFTPTGWVAPAWIQLLRKAAMENIVDNKRGKTWTSEPTP